MIAALPTVTPHEFDLIVKTCIIVFAVGLAMVLVALPTLLGWRSDAQRSRTADPDLMAVADEVNGPAQERLP